MRHAPRLEERERKPLRFQVRPVLRGRLGRLFIGIGAFEVGNAAATLLILRAADVLDERHGHDPAVTIALLLYAGYNLAATLASLQGGRVGDRRGMLSVLALGVAAFLAQRSVNAVFAQVVFSPSSDRVDCQHPGVCQLGSRALPDVLVQ